MIIDATDLIAGRVASYAAKYALLGEQVIILNSEKSIITGRKNWIVEKFTNKMHRGGYAGPFLPRAPHLVLKRIIRGMVPHKKQRGESAFKRIKCYTGVPDEFKTQKAITLSDSNLSKLPDMRYMTLGELCRLLGARQ